MLAAYEENSARSTNPEVMAHEQCPGTFQALFWISSNGTYMLVLSTEN